MEKNLIHTKGDTLFYSLTIVDSNEVAIDITGASLVFSIKEKQTDTTYILQKNLTITDAENGLCELNVVAGDMDLDVGNYYYDFQYTDKDGQVATFLKWILSITYEITS